MNVPPTAASAGSHPTPAILVIFALTYLGLAMGKVPGLKVNRVGIALLGAIAVMIFGRFNTGECVGFVNWPTILLLFGFFVISAQLRLSGFYDLMAGSVAARLGHPARFLLLLMVVAGGLSAILNNDVVCLVFTPVIASALLRRGMNPVPFLVALAVASNFGAAATLIGNAQNMMIGAVAKLGFGHYLLYSIVPVLVSLGVAFAIIWFMSRGRLKSAIPVKGAPEPETFRFNLSHAIKGLVILALVVCLLFTAFPAEIVALAAAGFHLASPKFRTEDLLRLVEWQILVLFMGLFVVTGAFAHTGCGANAVHGLAQSGFDLNRPANLALATGALSNLINNSAAVMLLLKVVNFSTPQNAYVLALANSFAGSLLLVGSVANLIVVQQARDLGVEISFREYARLGVPVTLAAFAALLCWVAVTS